MWMWPAYYLLEEKDINSASSVYIYIRKDVMFYLLNLLPIDLFAYAPLYKVVIAANINLSLGISNLSASTSCLHRFVKVSIATKSAKGKHFNLR